MIHTTAYIPFVNSRVSDIRFALDSFSNDSFVSQIPGFSSFTTQGDYKRNVGFDTNRVRALGHSLGGASTATTMFQIESAYVGAFFFDGFLIGKRASLLEGPSREFPEVGFDD